LFQSLLPTTNPIQEIETEEEPSESEEEKLDLDRELQRRRESEFARRDARELFNAGTTRREGEPG